MAIVSVIAVSTATNRTSFAKGAFRLLALDLLMLPLAVLAAVGLTM